MACTKNSNAKSTKMAKLEVAKHSVASFILKQFFVYPKNCAFCLREVLPRCHQYTMRLKSQ